MMRVKTAAISGACFVAACLIAWNSLAARAGAVSRGASSNRTAIGSVSNYTPGNCTDPNVAAYFSMNQGNAGSLIVPKRCGAAGLIFTKVGTPTFSVASQPGLGNAITFNGTTDGFTHAADSTLQLGSSIAFVFECWMKTTATSGNKPFFNMSNGSSNGYRILFTGGNQLIVQLFDGSVHAYGSSLYATLHDGNWHKIRISQSGTVISYFVDGVAKGTSTGVITSVTDTATAAFIGDSSGTFWNGQLDEVRMTIGNSTNDYGSTATPTSRAAAVSRGAAQ